MEVTFSTPIQLPAGNVIAVDVSPEQYLEKYADSYHEWVKGAVIAMTPASARHDALTAYLRMFLEAYLAMKPVATVRSAPFVMRTEEAIREPDLQIILNNHRDRLTDTATLGPADICIEVVSAESVSRDYGDKFAEYERVGVQEYWLIDPLRNEARFFQLQSGGHYATLQPALNGYITALLPAFILNTEFLWQDPLPDFFKIAEMVRAMVS